MKRFILFFVCILVVGLVFTGCAKLTKFFEKTSKQTTQLTEKIEDEFKRLDDKIAPIVSKYKIGQSLYYQGIELYTLDKTYKGICFPSAKWELFDSKLKFNFLENDATVKDDTGVYISQNFWKNLDIE